MYEHGHDTEEGDASERRGRLTFTTCNRWDSNWVLTRVGDVTAEQELLLNPAELAFCQEEIDAALGDEDFRFEIFDADGNGFLWARVDGRTTAITGPLGAVCRVEMDREETVLAVLSLYRAAAVALFGNIQRDLRRRIAADSVDRPVATGTRPVVR